LWSVVLVFGSVAVISHEYPTVIYSKSIDHIVMTYLLIAGELGLLQLPFEMQVADGID